MKYHKLLSKQIQKYMQEDQINNPAIEKFLTAINDSYHAFDKDAELSQRAFRITEEEYTEVNNKLKQEVEIRRQSVEKLKEAVGKITGEEKTYQTDDLFIIARYLTQQVSKRKNAELVFTSLITNLPSAILLEDETRHIVFVNQRYCDMFSIPLPPESLQGMEYTKRNEEIKYIFKNPAKFISRINIILEKKELVSGEIIELENGNIFERDYIPVFLDEKYKGNLWRYTDITQKRKADEEFKRMSLVASANRSGVLFTSFDGKITWANDGFTKLTGYSQQEILGKTPIEICRGPLTDKNSLDKVLNAFYSGNPFSIEIIYYKKDGSWFWGRSTTQPVKDNKGNVTQFFGIIDDVTEEKESEDRFRNALDKIGDNVWEHNFFTGETNFSDTENHLLGYSKNEFNNNVDLWWNNVYPEDKYILEQNDARYKSGKQNHHTLEYRMIHKSGEIRWVLDKGVILERTTLNKPLKIIGTHTDITLIKQTEKALRENEERLQMLEKNIPGVLYKYEYYKNGTGNFTYISPGSEKKIGIQAEQLQNFYEILHPDDVVREKRISKSARDKKTSYHFDGRFIIPDKQIIWLSISSSYSHTNTDETIVYTGIILNITKEKEGELIMQLREKKYRNIIANMNLGLLEVDNEEIVRYTNMSFCEMSGYRMDELIGKKASSLFLRDEKSELEEIKNQERGGALANAYQILVKNKKGEPKWWLTSNAPRYDERGDLVGSIGIHLDITSQKELEKELMGAREEAESSVKSKQIFLANMSHEIRTPMNAIIGMTNQLNKTVLNKDQQFYLNIIHSAADNLLIIINDILDLSKLEAGKLTLEEIGFTPKALINQAMQVMMHKAQEKNIILTNSFFDVKLSAVLIGDPYRLNQILLNLLSNAVKFTEQGSVDVICRITEDSTDGQIVEFVVTDTGIGMEETFLKNLFQKFRQEDESISRRFGGTGLGMSICKELIQFMGGNIQVQSRKGIGTSVTFRVPFKKGSEENLPVKETGVINSGILAGKKILITDDNEMNRLVASMILKNYGAILGEAHNGIEAIEMIKNENYDIVLMDVQMPVMDGIEATKIIREKISKNLPVIALTALALKGDKNKFLDAGMTDYLSKPFEEEQLLYVISKWLGNESELVKRSVPVLNTMVLYDLSKLYEIAKGNKSFIDKMINMFLEQGPVSVNEICNAYETQNFETVNKVAHRLKTSINNMGVSCLAEQISEIEHLAENNEPSERLQGLINTLKTVMEKVIEKLKLELLKT